MQVLTKLMAEILWHCGWQPQQFTGVGYWIALKPNEEPPLFLNSFYLQDLERVAIALEAGDVGVALRTYLSETVPNRVDVEEQSIQQHWLSPHRIPLGRWPTQPKHSLSLMQQTAVNQPWRNSRQH